MTTVAYDVSADDVLAFNVYHLQHAPGMRRYLGWTRFGTTSLAFIGVWSLVAYLQYNSRSILALVLATIAALIMYRATPAIILRSMSRTVRRMLQDATNQGMTGAQEIALTPDALLFRSGAAERHYDWAAIERIDATAGHLFIYVTPINALIVPSRAFRSGAERDAFVDAARSHLTAHESPRAANEFAAG